MAPALEPAFTPGRPVWPLAGMSTAGFEPDDPDLAIPHGALQNGLREKSVLHFPVNHNGLITHRPAEPLAPKPSKTSDLQRKWKLALIASCVFHVAVAIFFIQATDDEVLVEGSDFAGIASLGEAPVDQTKSGEPENSVDVTMVTMLDAVPVENVEAEAVPVDETVEEVQTAETVITEVETLKPVEETPVEQVNEAKAEQVQPAERVEAAKVEPQQPTQADSAEANVVESTPAPAVTETAPEVLATDRIELVDDDNIVQKPGETQAAEPVETAEAESVESTKAEPVEQAKPATNEAAQTQSAEATKVETSEIVKAEPTETKPVKSVEEVKPQAEAKPEKKPVEKKTEAEKPVQKKTAEKKAAKPKKAEDGKKVAEKTGDKTKQAGNGGKNQSEVRRGTADGQEKGDNRQASRGGSKNGEVGNAAVSNYPGKVRSKLARVARSVRAKGRGEVVVAFAVSSNGGVRSARVTRSSGVASVDQAALQAIRKASPFPPIPEGAGRSSWEFSIPLAFLR